MKKTKLTGIGILALGCALSFGFALVPTIKGGAETDGTQEEKSVKQVLEETMVATSAAVKLDGENAVDAIRFHVDIPMSTFETYESEIVETGTLVVPETMYTADELTLEAGESQEYKTYLYSTTDTWYSYADEDEASFARATAYVYGVPQSDYATRFWVRGYAKLQNGEVAYTPVTKRSMEQVAAVALESGKYDAYKTTLEKYVGETFSVSLAADDFETYQTLSSGVLSNENTTYSVDLSAENATEVVSVTLTNGTTVLKPNATVADGVVSIDMSVMTESDLGKTYQMQLLTDTCYAKQDITVVSYAISNETELNGLINATQGYFVLDSDITYEGVYKNTNANTFQGVLDGRGHVIDGLKMQGAWGTADASRGLFYQLSHAEVSNISFINSQLATGSGFLCSVIDNTKVENVYIEIAVTTQTGKYNQNQNAVLASQVNSGASFSKCMIVYTAFDQTIDQTNGYPVYQLAESGKTMNGVYAVGVNKFNYSGTSTQNVCGIYATTVDFKNANIDFDSWVGDFWTTYNGLPKPVNAPLTQIYAKTEADLETSTLNGAATFTVALPAGLQGEVSAKLGDTAFATCAYDSATGTLTLDTATATSSLGVKEISVVFTVKDDNDNIVVKTIAPVSLTVCTLAISNETELNSLIGTTEGYYVLDSDITCAGNYANMSTAVFSGTLDGRGHCIKNFTVTGSGNDSSRGLFYSISQATIKRIAFINATISSRNAMIASVVANSTIEDIYAEVSVTAQVGAWEMNQTCVLASNVQFGAQIRRAIVVYKSLDQTLATTGYPVYQLTQTSAQTLFGVYAVGVDKVNVNGSNASNVCGAYATMSGLTGTVDFSSWVGDFWTLDSNKGICAKSVLTANA